MPCTFTYLKPTRVLDYSMYIDVSIHIISAKHLHTRRSTPSKDAVQRRTWTKWATQKKMRKRPEVVTKGQNRTYKCYKNYESPEGLRITQHAFAKRKTKCYAPY